MFVKRFCISLAISLVLASCGGGPAYDSPIVGSPSPGGGSTPGPTGTLDPAAVLGKGLYIAPSNSCNLCHGPTGAGSPLGSVIDPAKTVYSHETTPGVTYSLVDYIETFMPTTDAGPTACDATCAESIAAYIASWSRSTPTPLPAATPTSVPVMTPAPVPVMTLTPVPVMTPTPVPVMTLTPVPVMTPTPVPVMTPTPVPTLTPAPPSGDVVQGKALYEGDVAICSLCHGNSGEGTVLGPKLDPQKDLYTRVDRPGEVYNLADYTELFMPTTDVTKCDADCALHVSAYIETLPPVVPVRAVTDGSSHGSLFSGEEVLGQHYYDTEMLADYIDQEILSGGTGSCVGECLRDLEHFVDATRNLDSADKD